MKKCLGILVLWGAVCPAVARAQHCAPILESYLSQFAVRSDVAPIDATAESAVELTLEYAKTGGRQQPAYQVYLIAYRDRDEKRVPAPAPAEFLDRQVVQVLQTQVVPRNEAGRYPFKMRLAKEELAKKLSELDRRDPNDGGAAKEQGFSENVRLAVFIPFLEDRTYSVLDGLPEDRHECNYAQARALLFQPLPCTLRVWTTEGVRRVVFNQSK